MSKKEDKIDLSKYRILSEKKSEDEDEEDEELTYYKYSDIERVEEKDQMVYHYFYDNLNENDRKEANIVLFAGKTGAGKTTAINAFFNIIKGVKLKDNFRFILIEEIKKPKGQAESQTDGVHLYYLKDYNNEPLIIIDSQGYGDTRGHEKDLEINQAFEYVFSHIIDHINTICFLANSTQNRIDISTKYIYSCVTALFAEDVNDNFIILATHANKDSMKKPAFVETIVEDADFLKINEKMNQKWWYAFDSKLILDNDSDKITKYSYKQLTEFYEEAVKKSFPKSIKNCALVLSKRNSLRKEVNKLNREFKELMIKQKNLNSQNELIIKNTIEISMIQQKIEMVEKNCKDKSPAEQEKLLNELNQELNNKFKEYSNQTISKTVRELENSSERHTYCNNSNCKENCHSPCVCWFTKLGRCKIFEVKGCLGILKDQNDCEHCGHKKSEHGTGNSHYVSKEITEKINNEDKIKEYENLTNKEMDRIRKEIDSKKSALSGLELEIKELKNKKVFFEKEKTQNELEKTKIKDEIEKVYKKILLIIVQLQQISKIIDKFALNNSHIKTQNDYINELENQLDDIGDKKNDQKKKLEELKNINNTFMKSQNINLDDLENISNEEMIKKIQNYIIPSEEEE